MSGIYIEMVSNCDKLEFVILFVFYWRTDFCVHHHQFLIIFFSYLKYSQR